MDLRIPHLKTTILPQSDPLKSSILSSEIGAVRRRVLILVFETAAGPQ